MLHLVRACLVTTQHRGSAPQAPHLDSSRGSTASYPNRSFLPFWFWINCECAQYLSHPVITRSVTDGAEAVHQRLKGSTQKTQRRLQRKLTRRFASQTFWDQVQGTFGHRTLARRRQRSWDGNKEPERMSMRDTPTKRPGHLDLMGGARTTSVGRDASQTVAKPGQSCLPSWIAQRGRPLHKAFPHARCN